MLGHTISKMLLNENTDGAPENFSTLVLVIHVTSTKL